MANAKNIQAIDLANGLDTLINDKVNAAVEKAVIKVMKASRKSERMSHAEVLKYFDITRQTLKNWENAGYIESITPTGRNKQYLRSEVVALGRKRKSRKRS